MKLDSDKAFISAKIEDKNRKVLYIYKVNAKSFYAGEKTYPVYEQLYNERPPKQTFKNFCEAHGIKQDSYADGFEIAEEELKKKEDAPKAVKKASALIGKAEKLVIQKVLEQYSKKKKKVFCLTLEVGKTTLRIVVQNGNSLLLNIDDVYYLYNTETEKTEKLGDVFSTDLREETVPWERVA